MARGPALSEPFDARGIEHLYVIGMDELFAKDAAFFHDNFAGSLIVSASFSYVLL